MISVIIPTYRRDDDLSECLDSLLLQTTLPDEVIIIDNANWDSTKEIVASKRSEIGNINWIYIRNGEHNSPTVARNIGIQASFGTHLFFLDDDVVLEQDFIEKILDVFRTYPSAVGVQGFVTNKRYPLFVNQFLQHFYLTHAEKDRNRLLPSVQNVYAIPLTKIIECSWLMSGCTCYTKKILNEFRFDEKLLRYSSGDDSDLSYRIYNKYPGTLFQTPYARLIHKVSSIGRSPSELVIRMGQVYSLYLFYKNFGKTRREIVIFVWSRFGLLFVNIGLFVIHPSKESALHIWHYLQSYKFCLEHRAQIKQGDIDFFTKDL